MINKFIFIAHRALSTDLCPLRKSLLLVPFSMFSYWNFEFGIGNWNLISVYIILENEKLTA